MNDDSPPFSWDVDGDDEFETFERNARRSLVRSAVVSAASVLGGLVAGGGAAWFAYPRLPLDSPWIFLAVLVVFAVAFGVASSIIGSLGTIFVANSLFGGGR